MEIRDLVHGSIHVEDWELPVLDSLAFQRLRQIKQLGFAELSFPSASHSRYIHSLGAMETATRAWDRISASKVAQTECGFAAPPARFRAALRLAALLHDVGHGPLSHTTEFAMPMRAALGVPGALPAAEGELASHEDYTLKILLDSPLTPDLARAGERFGFDARHLAALIDAERAVPDDFFREGGVDFRPLLSQLISSELDCDRMDYLRRDSLMAGVSYGHFDFDWISSNLTAHRRPGPAGGDCAYLALQHRALYAFEDYLLSRFHMFLMVYTHYKSVVFDEMLARYFASSPGEYRLPADVESYLRADDAQLYAALARSTDPWARRISEKRPFRMLAEMHSGIPATDGAASAQAAALGELEAELEARRIPALRVRSANQLSKYARSSTQPTAGSAPAVAPLFVHYDNHWNTPGFIPLERCTDLFERYREKRFITRVYVSPEDHAALRKSGLKRRPLAYDGPAATP